MRFRINTDPPVNAFGVTDGGQAGKHRSLDFLII